MTNKKIKYSHDQSPLFNIQTKKKLAEVLSHSLSDIKNMMDQYKNFYNVFVEKQNGKERKIEEPIKALRILHNKISKLLARISPPDFLYCPVKGKSSVSNAEQHISNGELVKLDVRKYFPSTTFGRIFDFFLTRMNCSRDVAWILATLCTYEGHLPTGSPLSPYMSYYAHEPMWLRINELCNKAGYKMTVYMDDIAISAAKISKKAIWQIKQEINKYGLKYHKGKSYGANKPKLLTGAVIKDGRLKLRSKHHLKIMKTERALKACSDENEKKRLESSLKGLLAYQKQVEAT